MQAFVTGAAGFIGSNLADRLIAAGHGVVGYDNFSTGRRQFLEEARRSASFRLEEGDLLDFDRLHGAMQGSDVVFHLAANADVRFGTLHPRKDLEQNTLGTWNVLEAMRLNRVGEICFASTGSVYGEPSVFPTPEDCPFPVQTSLYGASKLAAEGLVAAYSEGFGLRANVFRFVSILGERYSHGHVFDFCKQLREHPERLDVLGDGHQRKSYLYVQDCIDGILLAHDKAPARINFFNLGHDSFCEVNESISWIAERLGRRPRISYSGGTRGWIGDSPFILLDCARLRALGWAPSLSIRDAIVRTVDFIEGNGWLLDSR